MSIVISSKSVGVLPSFVIQANLDASVTLPPPSWSPVDTGQNTTPTISGQLSVLPNCNQPPHTPPQTTKPTTINHHQPQQTPPPHQPPPITTDHHQPPPSTTKSTTPRNNTQPRNHTQPHNRGTHQPNITLQYTRAHLTVRHRIPPHAFPALPTRMRLTAHSSRSTTNDPRSLSMLIKRLLTPFGPVGRRGKS